MHQGRKQIREMAKGRTKNKNVVGEITWPSEAVDGLGAKFALQGMGLGGLPTGVVGGSGKEGTSAEPSAPPRCAACWTMWRRSVLRWSPVRRGCQQGRDRHGEARPRSTGCCYS